MRISDWSSDVCSSDLRGIGEAAASCRHRSIRRQLRGAAIGKDRRRFLRIEPRLIVHVMRLLGAAGDDQQTEDEGLLHLSSSWLDRAAALASDTWIAATSCPGPSASISRKSRPSLQRVNASNSQTGYYHVGKRPPTRTP